MEIFELSKRFPNEEKCSLTDQVRRASRSVAANIAESWGKRRYPAVFVNKLSDAEAESLESQAWLIFAMDCGYLAGETGEALVAEYEALIRSLVYMSNNPNTWCFPKKQAKSQGTIGSSLFTGHWSSGY